MAKISSRMAIPVIPVLSWWVASAVKCRSVDNIASTRWEL